MSIIYGIFYRRGQAVNPEDMQHMHDALSDFPHEKQGNIICENAAFGHFLTYNSPESVFENLPLYSPEKKLLFTATGRVDNRQELASLLNIKLTHEITDCELILRTYLNLGKGCSEEILGDWSFAAFHFDRQELFIARDHHGYTSVFYYITDQFIAFSSNIKGLLSLPQINKELNSDRILHTLSVWYPTNNETCYKNIYLLPPAHSLTTDATTFLTKRYWFPEKIGLLNSRTQEDVISELEDIFVNAIKSRLRSHKPVASMLSGGLDSGSVSYIAADLLRKSGKKLTTFSHVPLYEFSKINNTRRFGNEKPFIEKTVKASGNINPVYMDSSDVSVLDGIFKVIDIMDGPIHGAANAYWGADLPAKAAQDGFGTLLSGEHGNATISFTGVSYLLPWKNHRLTYSSLKHLLKNKIARPLLLNNTLTANLLAMKKRGLELNSYSYINPEYAKKACLEVKMLNSGHNSSFNTQHTSAQELQLKILEIGGNPRCLYGAAISQHFGIEKRDATADKRVIEYIMTMPNELFFDQSGNGKNVIKKLMTGRLPREVLYNKAKGLQSADIGQRVMAEKDRMEQQLSEIMKNEHAREMIDFNSVMVTWRNIKENSGKNIYDTPKIQHFLRTLMVGIFMAKF